MMPETKGKHSYLKQNIALSTCRISFDAEKRKPDEKK